MEKPLISCYRERADTQTIEDCRELMEAEGHDLEANAQVFAAFGNPIRTKILRLLQYRPGLCVCDLEDILGMSSPALSQHLRKLKTAHCVESEREGTLIRFYVRPDVAPLLTALRQPASAKPSAIPE